MTKGFDFTYLGALKVTRQDKVISSIASIPTAEMKN
jgi:hypothetical protein